MVVETEITEETSTTIEEDGSCVVIVVKNETDVSQDTTHGPSNVTNTTTTITESVTTSDLHGNNKTKKHVTVTDKTKNDTD